MALRDQPYLPLYVQDFLTDEKLMECSPAATGIYIRIMCIMHKSDPYGTILLKQKDCQNSGKCQSFATKLAKFMPYTTEQIYNGLTELISEGVLQIKDDALIQKRMVSDNRISEIRSKVGSKGGFAKAKTLAKGLAKDKANTEDEIVSENESDLILKGGVGGKEQFNEFRRIYPGTKRGLDIEFENFTKKHKDWRTIIPLLIPSLQQQDFARKAKAKNGGFVPEWKNLSTWINQRCWEEEIVINNVSNETNRKSGATTEQLINLIASEAVDKAEYLQG